MTKLKKFFYFFFTSIFLGFLWWLILIFNLFPKKYYLQEKHYEPQEVAIIVLTGGKMRIEKGLNLLENGYGKKLFISGVFQSSEIETKYSLEKKFESQFLCCVFFGEKSKNTIENAYEVKRWLSEHNDIKNIILVTSYYHIPRSLIIFQKIIPNIEIITSPAVEKNKLRGEVVFHIKLIFSEYFKVLYTLMTIK